MPGRDGSGNYIRHYNWRDDEANSINIQASRMDEEMDEMANALSESIAKDGQTIMTGNLQMGGNKIENIANASELTDAVTAGQVQDNRFCYLGKTSGGPTDYLLNPSPAILNYRKGQEFSFVANIDNVGSSTLNISNNELKNIRKVGLFGEILPLSDSDIKQDHIYKIRYDGDEFIIIDHLFIKKSSSESLGVVKLARGEDVKLAESEDLVVPVAAMVDHPGVAKAWAKFDVDGNIENSFNIDSVIDESVSIKTINFSKEMANEHYVVHAGQYQTKSAEYTGNVTVLNQTKESFQIYHVNEALIAGFMIIIFG